MGLTDDEALRLLPISGIRNIAEYEPNEGVLIAYNGRFGIPMSLVKEISKDVIVHCLSIDTAKSKEIMVNGDVVMSNVRSYQMKLEAWCTRDWGPWCVFSENGELNFVDFTYNRMYVGGPRPNNNKAPSLFASQVGIPITKMEVVASGGNYMCDGLGIGASCDLVFKESLEWEQIPKQTVIDRHKASLGLTKLITMEDPLITDWLDHIDCWAKFLAPDKIIIKQTIPSHTEYELLEEAASFWSKQISSYGTPYKVYRVLCKGDLEGYTNSLIVNNKILLAFANNTANNEYAKKLYEKIMPGYTVMGFKYSSFFATDAIHCRTHEFADRGMLYIT